LAPKSGGKRGGCKWETIFKVGLGKGNEMGLHGPGIGGVRRGG